MQRRGYAWTIIALLLATTASAAINSWTSQVTGAWQDLTWSLGVRPDISQDAIMVTNYGQKAVIIDSTTVNSYPSTLTISNLNLAGTSLSTNTLLLNYTGTSKPLRVFNSITVEPNGILLNLFGAVSLEGAVNTLTINGGVVSQQGGSNAFSGNCYVGTRTQTGFYNLTNGTLSMGNAFVDFGGVFNQIDGTTSIASTFETFQSYNSLVGGSGPRCTVDHGAFNCGGMLITGGGIFYQGDAAIFVSNACYVGESLSRFTLGNGTYYLTNGTLSSGAVEIATVGRFIQYGGTHRTGTLHLHSDTREGFGSYELNGGNLLCASDENLDVGTTLSQSGGTHNIGGQLTVYESFFTIGGGVLGASNVLIIGDGSYGPGFEPSFAQNNADVYITNTLTVSSFATYSLDGGSLTAKTIELTHTGSYPPSLLNHGGGGLSSGGMIFSGGNLGASGTEMLGTLTLRGAKSIDSLSSNSVQFFAASAQIPWESNAVLEIDGWQVGVNHIYVGRSANALTPRQLQQITFAVGGYGKLLETGELVPWPVPPLTFEQSSTNLILRWPGTAFLQSADDPAGPYVDVTGASSPFMSVLNGGYKFFRLRQG
jgi:hypothetical protein